MSALCLLGLQLVLQAPQTADHGDVATVYRYRDASGMEHFVDQLDEIPPGTTPERVDLTTIPLNHETARALKENATKAAAARKVNSKVGPRARETPPPAETTLVIQVALALSIVFVLLVLIQRTLRNGAPKLAQAFGTVRFAAGALALMAWAGVIYEMRDSSNWLLDRLPQLQAYRHAKEVTEQVAKQRDAMERQIDESLRGDGPGQPPAAPRPAKH